MLNIYLRFQSQGNVWRSLLDETAAVIQVPVLLVVEVVSPGEENRDRDLGTTRCYCCHPF